MSTSGLIFLITLTIVNAQFNPRFQPQFASPPAYQRNMAAFAEMNGFGLPQMPAFGPQPSSNVNRMSNYAPPPQGPYGSPLFGAQSPMSAAPFGSPNQMSELALMEQQMFMGGFSQPINGSPSGRRPSFAQFGSQPPHFNGGLPPAFASLGANPMMSPVGGRAPFQRVTGQEMGSGSSNFNELEPFQQLPTEDGKQKREAKTE